MFICMCIKPHTSKTAIVNVSMLDWWLTVHSKEYIELFNRISSSSSTPPPLPPKPAPMIMKNK